MTICVVLVASVDSQLEQEILDAGSEYQHLAGLPKALLPVSVGREMREVMGSSCFLRYATSDDGLIGRWTETEWLSPYRAPNKFGEVSA